MVSLGMFWKGWQGLAGTERQAVARCGASGPSLAGMDRLCKLGLGAYRYGRQVQARNGVAGRGLVM